MQVVRSKRFANWFVIMAVIFVCSGCGKTITDRKAISRRTKDLAGTIHADPESKKGKEAFKELTDILNGEWRFARCQACYALGELGPLAAPAVPDLIRAANCGDGFVEQDSVRALSEIGPAAAPAHDLFIEIVEPEVEKSNWRAGLRTIYAVRGLGNIGVRTTKAMFLLDRASRSEDESFAREAKEALDKLTTISPTK